MPFRALVRTLFVSDAQLGAVAVRQIALQMALASMLVGPQHAALDHLEVQQP